MISAKFLSKTKSLAELAILLPFLATVKVVVAAAPVPSLTTTKSPADGPAGKVIVIDPALATRNCPDVAFVLPLTIVGASMPPVADVQVVPFDFRTLPLVPGATKLGAPVPLPITTLFAVSGALFTSFPLVPSKATMAPSVADAGPATSPVFPADDAISLTTPEEFLKTVFHRQC